MPRATQDTACLLVSSGTEPSSSAARLSRRFPSKLVSMTAVLQPRRRGRATRAGLGWSPFARHYWGNHCCFLLLEVLRCFSSLRSPPTARMPGMTALQAAGLSHSETRGSKVICTSPRLIAAYRVLHRLREPRHPPCALSYFSYRHARKTSGRRSYFQLDLAGSHEPGVLVIVISTTVLLVQHVKDRVRQAGERCRPSCSAEWRITDSNR